MMQGEFEEARSIMKKMGAENKLMHAILAQGRGLVGNLQEATSEEGNSPKVNVFLCYLACDHGVLVSQNLT